MTYYPVYLNLKGRRVSVIGGGKVAERKVASLLDSGASIEVISPEATVRIAALANAGIIEWQRRPYSKGDCVGVAMVFSATDDPDVSRIVFDDAREAGALVNTADETALCDFIMPAVVRRGDLSIAISTGGRSPALASQLRRKLSKILGPEYGRLLSLMSRVRPEIRQRVERSEARKHLHHRILRSGVLQLLRRHDGSGAEKLVHNIIEEFALEEQKL